MAAMTDMTNHRQAPRASAAARLDFQREPRARTILDGVWWPRSRDTAAELTELVVALDARQARVTLIMLNPDGWRGHPRRIEVGGRTVRVAWFVDLDTAVLIATTTSHQRIDLLVTIANLVTGPATTTTANTADQPGSAMILARLAQARAGGQPPDEAVWESEGGALRFRQVVTP
jgi:hypothetical protein